MPAINGARSPVGSTLLCCATFNLPSDGAITADTSVDAFAAFLCAAEDVCNLRDATVAVAVLDVEAGFNAGSCSITVAMSGSSATIDDATFSDFVATLVVADDGTDTAIVVVVVDVDDADDGTDDDDDDDDDDVDDDGTDTAIVDDGDDDDDDDDGTDAAIVDDGDVVVVDDNDDVDCDGSGTPSNGAFVVDSVFA